MPTIEHKNITDPEIHEPKGISTAAINTVYVANGAGSGSWGTLSNILTLLLPEPNSTTLYNTSFVLTSHSPFTGTLRKLHFSLLNSTSGSTGNFTVTVKVNGVTVTPNPTTVASPGPTFVTTTLTGSNTVVLGDVITVQGNGESIGTSKLINIGVDLEFRG